MELSILDRILLMNLNKLPEDGHMLFLEAQTLLGLKKNLQFSEEELQQWNIREEKNERQEKEIKWDAKKGSVITKDITFTPRQIKMLHAALTESSNISLYHVDLAKRLGIEVKDE